MLYLGIDAGASSTKWALLDSEGILKEGTSLSMDGHINREESKTRMISVLREIEAVTRPQKVTAIYAGITGISETVEGAAETVKIFRSIFGNARLELVTDIELGYRANLNLGEGIFLYAGTGSIALHIDKNGQVIRAGGWGYLLGDEGGGYWIGREAIRRVLFHIESQSPISPNSFENQILTFINCVNWKDIKSFVYSNERSKVASIARCVIELAGQGDGAALEILQEAAGHLANLIRRLEVNLGENERPIVFAGGLSVGNSHLLGALTRELGRKPRVSDIRSATRAAELARQ
ncbi:MAG TPA: BadF/BadG/BcrA/BcrD ATPase family protein [archaeon]|nr:BadF/BadG/BcrA/BcrD ATPase family protein [archaeon]